MDVAIVELCRSPQRPEWVDKVRPGERDEVGAAGGEDRVCVVRLVDIADRHGRELAFIADAIAERSLEHSAVDWLLVGPGLSGGNVDQVSTFAREGLARDYLFIDGAWRDHVLTSLVNPDFDPAWVEPAGKHS